MLGFAFAGLTLHQIGSLGRLQPGLVPGVETVVDLVLADQGRDGGWRR